MKTKRILIALSILGAAALACNLGAASGSPTDTPAAGPTGEPEGPTSEPSGGDGPSPTLNLDDPALYAPPDQFNTFRSALDYNFTAEGPVTGTLLLDSATQLVPFATTLSFYTAGSGPAGAGTVVTVTQVLDSQYIVLPGVGCQTAIPGAPGLDFDEMTDLGGILTGEAQFAGEGSANGVDTYIYTLTKENIDPLDPVGQDILSVSSGEIHIAREGGFIVRVLLEGRGHNQLPDGDSNLEGDVRFDLSFYDFDTPLTIEAPAACTSTGEPAAGIPLPEDAANIAQVSPDFLTFTTGESVEDVMEFYETEMPAFGCTLQSSSGSNDSASGTMAFEGCEFGAVQIIILAESSDVTLVNILSAP